MFMNYIISASPVSMSMLDDRKYFIRKVTEIFLATVLLVANSNKCKCSKMIYSDIIVNSIAFRLHKVQKMNNKVKLSMHTSTLSAMNLQTRQNWVQRAYEQNSKHDHTF